MFNYLFSLLTSAVITAFAIPGIIRVARIKHLFDEPDERKHHKIKVPTLGGMAIFAGLLFSLTFWTDQVQIVELQYIICSLLILFFIGIKDDLVSLQASKKLLGQICAAVILVHMAGVKLTTFYGMFGINNLPLWFSYIFSVFTCVVITNSFNLIDGIDGLAGSLGIVGASTFGIWYYFLGMTQYTILCSALIGSLLAFLWFNKTPSKIFMGDTGSMIVGFIMALLAMKFIESVRVLPKTHPYKILSVPVFTLTVLIIPLFDTLRVFLIRVLNGKSPFHPDRNHVHHILIDLGMTHIQATASLVTFNVIMILGIFALQGVRGETLLGLILFVPTLITSILTRLREKQRLRMVGNVVPILDNSDSDNNKINSQV
jgi:UDP-N-acetylmuramyl pentapeptide phosphotransferase/UDP-N-acetylglucosamine-1-phosphate transferase